MLQRNFFFRESRKVFLGMRNSKSDKFYLISDKRFLYFSYLTLCLQNIQLTPIPNLRNLVSTIFQSQWLIQTFERKNCRIQVLISNNNKFDAQVCLKKKKTNVRKCNALKSLKLNFFLFSRFESCRKISVTFNKLFMSASKNLLIYKLTYIIALLKVNKSKLRIIKKRNYHKDWNVFLIKKKSKKWKYLKSIIKTCDLDTFFLWRKSFLINALLNFMYTHTFLHRHNSLNNLCKLLICRLKKS